MRNATAHKARVRNFHLPLSDALYDRLSREAARRGRPATAVARAAIAEWLRAQERAALHREIAAYAAEMAGTEADLDPALESASVEYLLAEGDLP